MASSVVQYGIIAFLAVQHTGAFPLQPRACSFSWGAENGDNCKTMAEGWGLTENQFKSFNPGVDCTSLVPGQQYCVEWSGTPPSPPSTTTSTVPVTSTSTPTTSTTAPTTAPAGHSPTQDGISKDCKAYYLASAGDTCGKIVSSHGTFTLEEFYQWNPAVGSTCSGLWLGYYYCVGVDGTPASPKPTVPSTTAPSGPSPTQEGIAPDCERHHFVKSGDSCQNIVDTYGTFTLDQFYSWNPAVGKDCSSLWASYFVCIGVKGTPDTPAPPAPTSPPANTDRPSPTQSNVSPTCNKWYLVSSGDYCQKIADESRLSLSTFYQLNPDVGSSCESLWLGYYVCVGSN